MEQLIIGETDRGTYYVRPMSWAGIWDKDGKLSGCNTLYESKVKMIVNHMLIDRSCLNW